MTSIKTNFEHVQFHHLTVLTVLAFVWPLISGTSSNFKVNSLRFYDPPNSDPDGVTMGLLQATVIDLTPGSDNVSNWLPICELAYYTAERACDMLLPASYDMFFAGSTISARDIQGVAYCLEIDCTESDQLLSDCAVSFSFDQVMTSYLICLDKPVNRECWVTDSNMPMYCVEPTRYDRVSNVYTYFGFTLAIATLFVIMFGFLCSDARRILHQNKVDNANGSSKGSADVIGMTRNQIS